MTLFIFLNRVIFSEGAEAVWCYIYSKRQRCGRLETHNEGLYTAFEARVSEAEGLMRLWFKSRGRIFPLGVMKPCGSSAYLKRRFSRLQMQAFPGLPEEAYIMPADEKTVSAVSAAAETEVRTAAEAGTSAEKRSFSDGSILISDSSGKWLALPAELRKKVPGLRLRKIGGREYILFRY